MKLKESVTVEFKGSTAELKQALEDICAFANNGDGILYFGIVDDGKVRGQDVSDKTIQRVSTSILSSIEPRVYPNIYEDTINGKTVLVVEIKNGPDRPYFYKGKAYKRVGTSNAYLSRYEVEKALYERDNPKYRYEKTAIKEYKDALDRKTINWFLEKAKEERFLPVDGNDEQNDILKKLNLVTNGQLNLAGLVCFGKEIQRYVPESLVKCAIFDGLEKRSDRIVEYEDFRTNIFEQIEGVHNFIQKNCRRRYAVNPETAQREAVYEWPLLAIREALSNAIAHRDYMISGHTDIAIFDDRIEIWSSGTLPEGIKIEDLDKTHKSVLRNPAIAEMLYFAGHIERWGSGIKAMNTFLKQAGLPKPTYEEIGSNFVVTFKKAKLKDRGGLNGGERLVEKLVDGLVESQKNILKYVAENPYISKKVLSGKIGISTTAIDKNMEALKRKGLLKRIGPARGGHWEVVSNDKYGYYNKALSRH